MCVEHRNGYVVKTPAQEFDAELIGNLRFTLTEKSVFPAVGDWVAISEYDEGKALIHAILPRKTVVERKAVGKQGQTQVIAANIDVGIIVQSVNRDFNINRLERYLTICNASKIEPIIVLSKVDLIEQEELDEIIHQVNDRIQSVSIFAISNQSQVGIDALKATLIKGKTYCLLGSSGVGKSTLINTLSGTQIMETGEISEHIDRGKHVTTHRELLVLENGILIDNPGMREVGITQQSEGLEMTFDAISTLAEECKFKDCTHTNETGCAVLLAIQNDELDAESYANFLKMEKERSFFETTSLDRKKREKSFGKLMKSVVKHRKDTKY